MKPSGAGVIHFERRGRACPSSTIILLVVYFLILTSCARPPAPPVVLHFAGDTMLGTLYPSPALTPGGGAEVLRDVTPALTNGHPDLVVLNLEGSVSLHGGATKDVSTGQDWCFRMPLKAAEWLFAAGVDIVSTANNHAYDFGARGYAETRTNLAKAGVDYFGDAGETLFKTVRGSRIAFLGFSWQEPFQSILDIPACAAAVSNARLSNALVVCFFHGGGEGESAQHVSNRMELYADNPRGNVVAFSRAMVDAGAALVIGSGPHLPRAMEIYRDRLIAYSLGNFATVRMFETTTTRKYTLVLRAEIGTNGEFLSGRIVPLIQDASGPTKGVPRPDSASNVISLIRSLSAADIPGNPLVVLSDGRLSNCTLISPPARR